MLAATIVIAVAIYICTGVVAAAALLCRGLKKLDPAAARSSAWFRSLIFPGLVALWPLFASRWLR